MRKVKSLKGKRRKFRILLDSAFAKPQMFPLLFKKFNVAHAVHTYSMSVQASDSEIYQKAVLESRFVLTVNFKDFKKLVVGGKPGVFGIESQLTNEQVDRLVSKFLSSKDPRDYAGKATRIPGN